MKAVVIGDGAAGLAAVKSFRKYDKTSPITVISKEGGEAYSRVLLPYVLRGKLSYDKLFLPFAKEFGRLGVEYIEGEAVSLDTAGDTLSLADGTKLSYGSLLVASGSSALWPPVKGITQPGIYTCGRAVTLTRSLRSSEKDGKFWLSAPVLYRSRPHGPRALWNLTSRWSR